MLHNYFVRHNSLISIFRYALFVRFFYRRLRGREKRMEKFITIPAVNVYNKAVAVYTLIYSFAVSLVPLRPDFTVAGGSREIQ